MKNKGLIIGGVAIVALGAFWWMRKKNAMASEGDGKSDTSTGGSGSTTTGGTGSTTTGGAGSTTTGGTGSTTTGGTGSTSTSMTLTSKPINGVQDLDGTPLGLDISSAIINNDARLKVQGVIVNMNAGERKVLNYIAVVDYPTRTSQAFKDALSSVLGANSSSLSDSVYNKLATASRFTPINTNQGAVGRRRDCRQEAKDSGIKTWQFRKMADYVNNCVRQGGFDSGFDGSYGFSQPIGEHAYSRTGFEIDKEDFEFNGDHIL